MNKYSKRTYKTSVLLIITKTFTIFNVLYITLFYIHFIFIEE